MNIKPINKKRTFKANKIATTKNVVNNITTNIDIYKLGPKDNFFLEKLTNKINLKNLYPKLDNLALARWEHILKYCLKIALNPNNNSYLAVSKNKPCGILTYSEDRNSIYLDGICSIPLEKNKKVNFTGLTLFLQLFKDAKENNASSIILNAVNNGPFNVIEKYEKIGFKKDFTQAPYTKMYCNKHKILKQLKEIPYTIYYKSTNEKNVNLNKKLII